MGSGSSVATNDEMAALREQIELLQHRSEQQQAQFEYLREVCVTQPFSENMFPNHVRKLQVPALLKNIAVQLARDTFVDDPIEFIEKSVLAHKNDPHSSTSPDAIQNDADSGAMWQRQMSFCVNKSPFDFPSLSIIFLVAGSRGDVQPFINLGRGLLKRGHKVKIATHAIFQDFVTSAELDFFPLKGDPELLMEFMVRHPDMITFNGHELAHQYRHLWDIFLSTWQACTHNADGTPYRPEVIVSNPVIMTHTHIAERLQVPLQIMFTMPWSATSEYPNPIAPMSQRLTNKGSYTVMNEMLWLGMGGLINKLRKRMGLASLHHAADILETLKVPHMYFWSASVIPKPADWGQHLKVVGYQLLSDETPPFTPTDAPDLLKFLAAGEPPFYIGFGSVVIANAPEISRMILAAVIQSKKRCILHQGWARLGVGLEGAANCDLLFVLCTPVAHEWLFPRCAAVCHHGGAGTTAAGLRFGRPTFVIPFFGDQHFWGAQVCKMNVGPRPIFHKDLTVDSLANAILFCYQPDVIAKAATLGAQLSQETGVENAITAFHDFLPVSVKSDGLHWVVRTYELERLVPLIGWSHRHLLLSDPPRWTDSPSIRGRKMERDGFRLPPGWRWATEWEVVKSDESQDGWQYALGFSFQFKDKETITDCARRRLWTRSRVFDPCAVMSNPCLPSAFQQMYVIIHSAENLPARKTSCCTERNPDTYITVRLWRGVDRGLQEQRTKVIHKMRNPRWNDTKFFTVNSNDIFELECWDSELIGKTLLGQLSFPLNTLESLSRPPHQTESILSFSTGPASRTSATIRLVFTIPDFQQPKNFPCNCSSGNKLAVLSDDDFRNAIDSECITSPLPISPFVSSMYKDEEKLPYSIYSLGGVIQSADDIDSLAASDIQTVQKTSAYDSLHGIDSAKESQ